MASTYQSLPVEAVLTRSDQSLHHGKRIAVQSNAAVYTQPGCMLQPQSPVHNLAQVRIYTGRTVLVVVCERQVEHVARPHQVAAVALDKLIEAFRGQSEDVKGVPQRVEVEDVVGPALRVGERGQVFTVLDLELCLAGEVVGALGFCEPWQAGAGMDEVREDVVDYFDW